MRCPRFSRFSSVVIAAELACALLTTGCAARARASYVPYDYFSWNSQVATAYNHWEHDTHREHLDFTLLNDADMRAFWQWQHRPNQH
jgi:hypothetical protein